MTLSYSSFDLDNTLVSVDFDKELYNDIIPRIYAEKHGISLDEAKQFVYAEYYKAKYIEQVHDWTSISRWINHFDIGKPNRVLDRLKELSEAYEDVKETLSEFAAVAPIAVFNNTNHHFLAVKTDISPLDEHVRVARSGPHDYGHQKAEEAAWKAYLDDLNVSAGDLIHIGDTVPDDVETPASLSITMYHLNRDNNPKGKGYRSLHDILREVT